MNTLPDIENFKNHKLQFSKTLSLMKQSSTADMDLDIFHSSLVRAKHEQQDLAMTSDEVVNPTHLLYELFSKEFLFSFDYMLSPMFNKYIGYSKKHQSLTISIFDEDGFVKAIAVRKSKDKDGNFVKWKTYGSKIFIPHKINDDFIFLAVGMAEFVLFGMMKVSYILLQSDSVYRHISKDVISKTSGKFLIILKEQDISSSKLTVELQRIFIHSNIIVIDFEKLLNKQLSHGFDYRDYCNQIGDISMVEQQLEQEIIRQLKAKQ